ncbi:MAG: EAL domain-containing protein (putative c-di-GMP-specific phosphodiesterase class I) [Methylophilaceae bacterium]
MLREWKRKRRKIFLLNAGCDYGQGYYFSKLLPPAQFESYVKKPSVKKHLLNNH